MAPELTGTLKKIKDSGSITIGHRDSSIPFSYVAGGSKPVGYSLDLATAIIEALNRQLGITLEVRYNLCTSQTRIPLVQNGTIDLECGSTSDTEERQQQIAFSSRFFESSVRFLTKAKDGEPSYKDFSDLKGKNVAAAAGTTSERLIKAMTIGEALGLNVISVKDHGEALGLLEGGRAVAFVCDDALLEGLRATARQPEKWIVTGTPQSTEYYGLGMRRGDDAFKKVVDEAIASYFKAGQGKKSYEKWFESAIPPRDYRIKLEKSDWLNKLIG